MLFQQSLQGSICGVMMNFFKLLFLGFSVLLPTVAQSAAVSPPGGSADDYTAAVSNDDLLSRQRASYTLQPLTGNLFGENISLQNGDVSFSNIDLTVPGVIPIHISRSYRGRHHLHFNSGALADWSLDIPAIHTTMLQGRDRLSGAWGQNKACSGPLNPGGILSKHGALYLSHEYWNGDTINVPGYTSGKLLESSPLGQTSRYTADNWKFNCIQNSSGQEGFQARSPDGLIWSFNKYVAKTGPTKVKNFKGTDVIYGFSYLTEVKDLYGNWLKYNYAADKLISITSSDQREVTFSYHTSGDFQGHLSGVSYHDKQIKYQYIKSSDGGYTELQKVIRPDGKFWFYNTSNYHLSSPVLGLSTDGNVCKAVFNEAVNSKNITVTHPNGARLELTFTGQKFRRSNTPPTKLTNQVKEQPIVPECAYKWALTSKTLTNTSNNSSYHWRYDYSGGLKLTDWPSYLALSHLTPDITDNVQNLSAVKTTMPDGSQLISFYDVNYQSR
jgi:hypothetical protein